MRNVKGKGVAGHALIHDTLQTNSFLYIHKKKKKDFTIIRCTTLNPVSLLKMFRNVISSSDTHSWTLSFNTNINNIITSSTLLVQSIHSRQSEQNHTQRDSLPKNLNSDILSTFVFTKTAETFFKIPACSDHEGE